jgi:hypothetical protein
MTSEVLGISEWDGQGRGNQYPNGFLVVTHTGTTYYLSAPTKSDRDEWILQVKYALECHFANPDILPFKPSKIIQNRPQPLPKTVCAKTKVPLTSSAVYCRSCGRGYASSDMVSEQVSLIQLGAEEKEKVCLDCRNVQTLVLWLKTMTYMHAMTLHELTPEMIRDVGRYKASFRLRRRLSQRLDAAATMLEQVR